MNSNNVFVNYDRVHGIYCLLNILTDEIMTMTAAARGGFVTWFIEVSDMEDTRGARDIHFLSVVVRAYTQRSVRTIRNVLFQTKYACAVIHESSVNIS